MSSARGNLLILVLAAAAALAGLGLGRWVMTPRDVEPPAGVEAAEPGMRRPDMQLPDLAGQTQTLAQFDGAPLLVNFWATWCAPCIEELPRLADLHARRGDDGIAVLAVALEDDPDAVADFMREHALELPVWIEPPADDDHSVRFGNTRNVLPYSVLIGADGVILEQRIGTLDDEDLAEWTQLAKP